MSIPGLGSISAAWRAIVFGIMLIGVLVGGVYAYRAYDSWKAGKRARDLLSAGKHVQAADTLTHQADSTQVLIQPTKFNFRTLVNSPQTRSNPHAKTIADTATKIIKADSVTIDKQKKAIAHLDSANKDYQNAGPPLGPRVMPYAAVGYSASNRHRAVPMGKLGVDYRLLPHVFANLEGSYSPPPAKDLKQIPEWQVFVGGRINFR